MSMRHSGAKRRAKTTVRRYMRQVQEAAEDVKALAWEAFLASGSVPPVRDIIARLELRARWLTNTAEQAVSQLRAYSTADSQLRLAY
jgi:hypothetical protein